MSKPFSLGDELFDQTDYFGRLRKFIKIIDPRNLSYSDEEIREFQNLLIKSESEHQGGAVPGVSNEEMWHAQFMVDSAVHPDTNELVPKPFRMAGYVPCNIPILVGLLIPQGVAMTAFWQWLNQTHNALVNYANRNAKTPVSTFQQASGYGLAVGSAMGVSFILNKQLAKHGHKLKPNVRSTVQKIVPFTAVACASSLNTVAMRNAELTSGIEVYSDETGEVYGSSQAAAKEAIGLTVISRVVIAAGCLLAPPLATTMMERRHWINATLRPRQYIFAQIIVCSLSFFSILPMAIAIFPQTGTISKSKLETQFKNVKEETLRYNKGL